MLQDPVNGLGALTVILHVTGPEERVWFPGWDVTLQDLKNGFFALTVHVTGAKEGVRR